MGIVEIIVVGAIAVAVFGAGRLPAVGEGLGKLVANFKRDVKGGGDVKKPDQAETTPSERGGGTGSGSVS